MKNEKLIKIRLFERKVMDFYRKAGRESLPWRKEEITAYEVWVSEIMLQQTQVARVIEYYTKFLERFPTVAILAKVSWEEFLPYYAGLGYYRRGRNMLVTAQKVMNEFGGEFPRDKKLLMTLPGVGEYTSCAILSFAYGENHLAWDTNLKRVIGRFFYGSKDFEKICHAEFISASQKNKTTFAKDEILNPPAGGQDDNVSQFKTHAKEMNAALMDFGSAICLGRPKCKTCPLSKTCMYFSKECHAELVSASRENQTGFAKEGILNPPAGGQDDKKKRQSKVKINWKEAQVFLWLHKDHTLYYSAHPKRFKVFVLPPAYNSRSGIKAYFWDKYGLSLAVRPPHATIMRDGKPTLFVNAQILLGEPYFTTFSKDVVKLYNESMVSK